LEINEAMNGEGELFGVERMRLALEASARLEADCLGTSPVGHAHHFVGEAPQSNDLALLIVRYVPSPAEVCAPTVTVMEPVQA
jgi:serine phosphatase RsbU (regulator of sigma subunit)